MDEQELNDFTHIYYQSPDPKRVPEALACAVSRDPNPRETPFWYFFVRIIQDHPSLLREVEGQFRQSSVGRLFLLAILSQSGDDQSREFLRACADDAAFSSSRDMLIEVTQHWSPGRLRPLQHRADGPFDLDLLWCEFMASGAKEAVVMVIDALDSPDLIRAKLETYLHPARRPGVVSRWQSGRVIKKLAEAGVWIDADDRAILSPQDLDCHVMMENGALDRERLTRFRSILPFAIADEDLPRMAMKASAKWSLGTNAQRHPLVLQTCENESATRAGACRLALLEIAAFARLAANDLESAFNRLHDSLTIDPVARQRQDEEAQSELTRLSELTPLALANLPTAAAAGEVSELKAKCVEVMESLSTYRAELVLRSAEDGSDDPEAPVLELEFVRPDTYRVRQTCGPEGDEWVTMSATTFRAPVWTEKAATGSEAKFNELLLADRYLAMLQYAEPLSAQFLESGQGAYVALNYGESANAYVPRLSSGVELTVNKAVLWIDRRRNYLVKAEFAYLLEAPGKAPQAVRLVHCFFCQNAPIKIISPAFRLLH